MSLDTQSRIWSGFALMRDLDKRLSVLEDDISRQHITVGQALFKTCQAQLWNYTAEPVRIRRSRAIGGYGGRPAALGLKLTPNPVTTNVA